MADNDKSGKGGSVPGVLSAEEYQNAFLKKTRIRELDDDIFVVLGRIRNSASSAAARVQTVPGNKGSKEKTKSVAERIDSQITDPILTEAQCRKFYDDVFNEYLGDTDNLNVSDPLYRYLLMTIADFRKQIVLWAGMRGDRYVSLENGRTGGFMAVIPPGHEALRYDPPMFHADQSPGKNVLQIAPYEINKVWGLIGLCHGLYYLYARGQGLESVSPTRKEFLTVQANAVRTEIAAAEHCSKESYSDVLNDVVDSSGFESLGEYLAIVGSPFPGWEKILMRLDAAVLSLEPKSRKEWGMRQGFHSQAFALRLAELFAVRNGQDVNDEVAKVYERYMIANGAEKYLPSKR